MNSIKGTTRVCGLIGNPVEHSLSPIIHNTIAQAMGIDMAYVTFKVEDSIQDAVRGAYALNILGMNVTVPWKQDVVGALVDIDPLAKGIGAVNTLVGVSGGYKGYNTDILGIKRELEEADIEISGNSIVVLGAGGAARAIAFLMASEGADSIYILNRTVENARNIAIDVQKEFPRVSVKSMATDEYDKIQEDNYVVIQTTSVGLHPNCDNVVIEDKLFYERAMCGVDIIYNPSTTKFMKLMQEAGKDTYNGLKMLLYQGIAAFELWNNVVVPDEVTEEVYRSLLETLKG